MASMEGWLTKKRKQRYFLLRDNILFWFTSVTEPVGDLASKARGSLNLQNCKVKVSPDKQFTIAIEGPVETYYLKGKSDEEVSKWVDALSAAVNRAISLNQEMGKHVKTGWMEKKGKKRYFVLKEAILSWYLNEQIGKAQGQLDLKGCNVGPPTTTPDGKAYFVISVPYRDNIEYKLVCLAGIHEARAWAKAMTDAQETFSKKQIRESVMRTSISQDGEIVKSGWMEKKGKRRFFKLRNYLLCWYDQEPMDDTVGINGSLNVRGCQVAHTEYTLTIKPTVGNSYSLKASSVDEAADWVSVIRAASTKTDTNLSRKINMFEATKREGWLNKLPVGKRLLSNADKKIERRFLRVDNGDLKWFESDLWQSTSPKEVLHLARCQLTDFNDNTFMIGTGHGRDYPFQCQDSNEKNQWMTSLQFYIQKANEDMEAAVLRDQFLVGGRTHSERWVVLTKDGILMWFSHVVSPSSVTVTNANGWLKVSLCQVEKSAERQLTFSIWQPRQVEKLALSDKFALSTPTGVSDKLQEKLSFTTPDQESYDWWYNSLKNITEGKDATAPEEKKQGIVFGVPLPNLLEREGTTIPLIVTKCVEFISRHGKQIQGIFRLSGQAGTIQKYSQKFDQGEKFDFPEDLDVHAVSGILKSWLREMSEPAFTYNLYNDFLACNDLVSLKSCLDKLPSQNQDLIIYLFKFLHEMALYKEKTSMDVPNIAIVFGPNILRRRNDSDAASGLVETPAVLKVTQMLITNYYKIFGGEPPSAPTFSPPPPGLSPPNLPPPPLDIPNVPPPGSQPPTASTSPPQRQSVVSPRKQTNQISRMASARPVTKPPASWPSRKPKTVSEENSESDSQTSKSENIQSEVDKLNQTLTEDELDDILKELS